MNSRGIVNKNYIIGFFITFGMVIAILIYFLRYQHEQIKERGYEELKNLSNLKLESLMNYINEEKFRLNQLINSEFFKNKFVELLNGRTDINEVNRFLKDVKSIKHLEDIVIINPEGKILFSFSVPDAYYDTITIKQYKDQTFSEILIDICRIKKSDIVYFFQFPFVEKVGNSEKILGFIRFQFDALNSIIPRIEFFDPGSSKEILLLKQEGNEIIYLSYLKKLPIKPLNLTQDVNEFNCFKFLSKDKDYCKFEGLDYAGTSVLAIVQKVPNTNWLLMTKQNKIEIISAFRIQSITITLLVIVSFLFVGLLFFFINYRYQAKQLIREVELEKSKQSLERELEMISTQVSDAVFILNDKGQIIKTSKSVEKMYGYRFEEIMGKTIDVICLVDEMSQLQERFKIIETSENYIYESKHRKKDGSLIDVEVNARAFKINGDTYLIGSVRDISERKKALEELRKKLETEKFLTEIAAEMININFENFEERTKQVLNKLGDFIKLDRIRVFLKVPDTNLYNCEVEWCRFGIEPFKERLQFINFNEEFPFANNYISKGITYKCSDINLLPQEAIKEKEELQLQGIKSFFWKPLKYKQDVIGVLSFSSATKFKEWNYDDELVINIFTEILINTLHKINFEKKISESEKRYRKLVENSSDVTLIVSRDFKNLYISPSVINVLGYSVQERIGENPLDLIHPDDLQFVIDTLNSLKSIGKKSTIQFRVKHKLGHYIWIEATITNLYDDPLINGLVVNYHDITETKEAYLKLQESEERYRLLAEESGDVLYRLNYSTMRYDYLSPVIKNLTGYTPEEINEMGFSNIIEEISLILDPEKTKEEIVEKRIKGETGEYLADYKIKTKSGETKWVRDHSFPVFNNEGKLIGSIGILSDISELKKREEEIKKRERYLEVLVDIQKSLIFLQDLKEFYNYMLPKLGQLNDLSRCYVFENSIDENGRLLMSQVAEWCAPNVTPQIDNPDLQNLPYDELGFDLAGELINNGYWAALTKNVAEPTKSILEAQEIKSILLIPIISQDEFFGYIGFDDCYREKEWDKVEIEILKSAANSISLAIDSMRIRDEIIKREKYLETLVSIQQSLIYFEDLRELYNNIISKLGQVSEASRCYIFENFKDENGKIYMTQIAEWCAEGITPQINNPELKMLPYDELGLDLMNEMLEKGYWAKHVKNLPEPSKTILSSQHIISILLIPIMVQNEFYGYIGLDECTREREWTNTEIDILKIAAASISLAIESKRKQDEIIHAKDELIEANRLKAGFLSILSHEIRTPLNIIMGYHEVLEERFYNPSDPELQAWFRAIKNNSLRLLNTINQLIEISKLNAGALKVNLQKLNLNKYILDICNSFKVKADEKKLNLSCLLPEKEIYVLADDYCLHGILENLVMNSVKYSEKGTIEISVREEKDYVEVKIKDEGIGIDEKYLKHLFQPFSQEDVSYKRRFEGTGLGLAITKRYVELINGDIKVESRKGFGTTIYVKLRKAL